MKKLLCWLGLILVVMTGTAYSTYYDIKINTTTHTSLFRANEFRAGVSTFNYISYISTSGVSFMSGKLVVDSDVSTTVMVRTSSNIAFTTAGAGIQFSGGGSINGTSYSGRVSSYSIRSVLLEDFNTTGTRSTFTYLRGDGAWTSISGLSDPLTVNVANISTATINVANISTATISYCMYADNIIGNSYIGSFLKALNSTEGVQLKLPVGSSEGHYTNAVLLISTAGAITARAHLIRSGPEITDSQYTSYGYDETPDDSLLNLYGIGWESDDNYIRIMNPNDMGVGHRKVLFNMISHEMAEAIFSVSLLDADGRAYPNKIQFRMGDTNNEDHSRLTILDNGNIGIGYQNYSPAALLDLVSNNYTSNYIVKITSKDATSLLTMNNDGNITMKGNINTTGNISAISSISTCTYSNNAALLQGHNAAYFTPYSTFQGQLSAGASTYATKAGLNTALSGLVTTYVAVNTAVSSTTINSIPDASLQTGISASKIAAGSLGAGVLGSSTAVNSIGTEQIKNGAVTTGKLPMGTGANSIEYGSNTWKANTQSFGITVDSATTNYLGSMFIVTSYFPYAITITSVSFCTNSGTITGVAVDYMTKTTPYLVAGSTLIVSGITVKTAGQYGGTLINPVVPANMKFRIKSTGTTGTPNSIVGSFTYTVNR